jgi:hypothetical protein
MNDKNGVSISDGDTVEVPTPNNNDIWMHSFTGTVDGTHDKCVCVVDGDGDYWDVEPERLIVL